MAEVAMLTLFLSAAFLCSTTAIQSPAPAQPEAIASTLLDAVAVEFGDQKHSARDVLERAIPKTQQRDLLSQLERDPSYAAAFLASPRFLQLTRAYTDTLRLDELGLREATEEQLLAESTARAQDLKSKLTPQAFLRSRRLEMEVRARLLTQQPGEYSTGDLRRHMLRSVPEFFGEMSVAWIRIPLVDRVANRALSETETREVYQKLDQVAQALQAEEMTWEEAVLEYCKDPVTKKRKGAVGVVKRTMTDRFEEGMLRPLFADMGFNTPKGAMLRGPIVAEKWAYLIQVEALRIDGVPELQRERERVERSLRETLLQEQMAGIRKVLPAKVYAPILPKQGE